RERERPLRRPAQAAAAVCGTDGSSWPGRRCDGPSHGRARRPRRGMWSGARRSSGCPRFLPDGAQLVPQPFPGTRQPGLHRAGGKAKRRRDLRVGEVGPRVEQEDLALVRPQRSERLRELAVPHLRVDAVDGCLLVGEHGIDAGACVGAQHPPLPAPVVAHEVRGDAVQPRSHGPRGVEAIPAAERHGECLRSEIVRCRRAEPASEVAVERRELRLEGVLERAPHANKFPAVAAAVPAALRYLPAEEETYCATAWICASLNLPLNAGIAPPPTSTWWATTSVAGLIWSRFGPTVPVAPAAESVWQPAQPAPLKIL